MNDGKSHHAKPYGHPQQRDGHRAGNEPARARTKAEGWDAYNWLNRGQKSGSRHSAITRNLYSWSSYKSWADKVRNSWDRDK